MVLYEKEDSCGGHTLTDDTSEFPIDLGFQVSPGYPAGPLRAHRGAMRRSRAAPVFHAAHGSRLWVNGRDPAREGATCWPAIVRSARGWRGIAASAEAQPCVHLIVEDQQSAPRWRQQRPQRRTAPC